VRRAAPKGKFAYKSLLHEWFRTTADSP